MPNGERGYTDRSKCFIMGGDIREGWRDLQIAMEDMADGREYEHITTHLVNAAKQFDKLRRFAPHYASSFDSLDTHINDVIKMILGAPDTATSRQNLMLHIREIQERVQRMGLKMSQLCS